MPKTLHLISCVKSKATSAMPAEELFESSWFEFARAFAQGQGAWLILSAKHGVLEPTRVVKPYQDTLSTKGRRERRLWAEAVLADLLERTEPGDQLVFLAGERYRENLLGPLQDAGRLVEVPVQGLSQSQQLSWLGKELRAAGGKPPRRRKQTEDGKRLQSADRAARKSVRTIRAVSPQQRQQHLQEYYGLLAELAQALGGARPLAQCHGGMEWPQRGVYFFFEQGEERSHSGRGPRVVRVGTHAVSEGSRITLWGRLGQHQGRKSGGNHRGSAFRRLVGASLAARDPRLAVASWDQGNTASAGTTGLEQKLERAAGKTLGEMQVLWLEVADEPSKDSLRNYIAENSIALLSNSGLNTPLDPPSREWLGHHCPKQKIRDSGLWNSDSVDKAYDPELLVRLRELVSVQVARVGAG